LIDFKGYVFCCGAQAKLENATPKSRQCFAAREKQHPDWGRDKLPESNWWLVDKSLPHPRGVSDVWQTKNLKSCVFGCVADKGVTGAFYGCVANKEVTAHFAAKTLQPRGRKVNDSADTFTKRYMYHTAKKKSTVLLGKVSVRKRPQMKLAMPK
jgi:hypothetical protein